MILITIIISIALGLNHLQPGTWFAHGCASLICSRYSDAARSFRRCVTLEYDNYEAWANLSNAELRAGNKRAAHLSLSEAIKCNYEKWECNGENTSSHNLNNLVLYLNFLHEHKHLTSIGVFYFEVASCITGGMRSRGGPSLGYIFTCRVIDAQRVFVSP